MRIKCFWSFNVFGVLKPSQYTPEACGQTPLSNMSTSSFSIDNKRKYTKDWWMRATGWESFTHNSKICSLWCRCWNCQKSLHTLGYGGGEKIYPQHSVPGIRSSQLVMGKIKRWIAQRESSTHKHTSLSLMDGSLVQHIHLSLFSFDLIYVR